MSLDGGSALRIAAKQVRVLADRLKEFANRKDIAVLALPRGGVPVGYAVAGALEASQTTDEEVRQLLSRANARATPGITRSA